MVKLYCHSIKVFPRVFHIITVNPTQNWNEFILRIKVQLWVHLCFIFVNAMNFIHSCWTKQNQHNNVFGKKNFLSNNTCFKKRWIEMLMLKSTDYSNSKFLKKKISLNRQKFLSNYNIPSETTVEIIISVSHVY